ncbi:ABC transporter permease [Pseudoalteromonas luteoviolacea]|uniref:ABC-type Na+ efflux pump, permease component n=1 Tax=Pseudoalteromonas luteoviolacea (strain 2ta16) TaxID=1353533 RepID=V4I1W8_PSEL2|nr:ABC transporter permease [Pseudoalteromonas luteoviolacea]ESP94234.1 ABC-type Na+ efflux pump, permease component [Pseudoalteromonas luteoviolacea 2ta16]KZN32843.1 transporter [Pseudoalteromonas luteoviolacea NCIMB 1944]
MIKLVQVLYKKEMLDASRDKRSVMAGLYYAIGAPIVMCLLFTILLKQLSSPEALEITVENSDAAPSLVSYLEGFDISHGKEGSAKAITLIIDEDYEQDMSQGRSARVTIVADKSDNKLIKSVRRLEAALARYNSEVAGLRLISRGIDPSIMRAINVQTHDQATPDSKGGMFLGIATLSIIIALFYSAMNLAIDTSAGERERNSLALLLSHPLSSTQIVLAKVAAIASYSMIGLVLVLIVSKFAYGMVPWEQLGFSINLDVMFILFCTLIGIPIALMSASLLVFVSFMAKSFKEAQSYVAFVLFVPIGLSMMTTYDIATDYVQWIPIAAQQYAMIEVIKGNELPLMQVILSSFGTLALFAIFTMLSSRMLKSEKVVFGL